jgi:squalene-hopene/tetraprenyl-beta-curcumene cyclase
MSVAFVPARSRDARLAALEEPLDRATRAALGLQKADGHWVFELEADATIPAEYILLRQFRGEAGGEELEAKIANYLRRIQGPHGGWGLYHDGPFDISASVKAYFALKTAGDAAEAPHMKRARDAILRHGGAEHSNVFTRVLLALYGILPWHSVPEMPVEIMLLPRWFPFHLSKMSYWARTVLVPLLVLQALRPRAKNPRGITIDELFAAPPQTIRSSPRAPHQKRSWFAFFSAVHAALHAATPLIPSRARRRAIERAAVFVEERLNGLDGLGAIFPAMANATLMFDALGRRDRAAVARQSIERLLVVHDKEAYCQPCVSPVWDTALMCHALLDARDAQAQTRITGALDWLASRQVLDVVGDWAERRPGVKPGGWAFQYENPHYPDLDDTAVVVMAMDRARHEGAGARFDDTIARAVEWVVGLQSKNGGWAAFDADDEYYYLNNIPFADHGALLDPPTEDVTARCVSMLAQLGEAHSDALQRGVGYLLGTQQSDGSWYGRWGMNYIYGTWSVLCALNAAGVAHDSAPLRKAVDWLVGIQNPDGGWGEDGDSYKLDYRGHETAPSTASQTAWALLGLMAAGAVNHAAVERGVAYLLRTQVEHGFWDEERFTATGFPRVFYLRYHGYRRFFPLWALARYRNLKGGNGRVPFGM